jgi:polyhydroxyalkanoate synthesis repressor PhaR
MKTIKKYSNRKLYDTQNAKYINFSQIIEFVENGEDLEIIEHGTEKDVTKEVLLKCFSTKANISKNQILELLRG